MPTNGEGKFCDWLNHIRSMADAPDFWSRAGGGVERHDGYVMPKPEPITWRGNPVSERNAKLLWGQK